jgi:hypothetical protein
MTKASNAFNALPFDDRKLLSAIANTERIQSLKVILMMVVEGHKKTLAGIDGWIEECESHQKREEEP